VFITYISLQSTLTTFILNASLLLSAVGHTFLQKSLISLFWCYYFSMLYSHIPISFIFGLQNVLAIIHPVIILLSYSFFIKFFLVFKKVFTWKSLYISSQLSLGALALGGWWAFQEFNWGGWWNWDSIETPILLYLILVIFYAFHFIFFKNKTIVLTLCQNNFFILLLILLIFLPRWGQTNSIHSFINSIESYLYYHTWILTANIKLVIIFSFFKLFSLWTFFFIKFILIYVGFVWLWLYILDNKILFISLSHKFYFIILILISCLNLKNLYISIDYLSFKSGSPIQIYSVWYAQTYLFWLKPFTSSINSFFWSLKFFLN